jgi:Protein of unknown function (DUF1592)/Protein of unknown function (DUF1588)/Protein of unknown function (DUF1585)/Protein of unknown function (DUF1587)/Protein of unknown function (DUF1595)
MNSRVTATTLTLLALLAMSAVVNSSSSRLQAARVPAPPTAESLTAVVRQVCAQCHNEKQLAGDFSLEEFDVAKAASSAPVAEAMITKLRAGMMPPPGRKRPGGDTLAMLASTLERVIDQAAAAKSDPGGRTFQRLNRVEYERSVHDLLDLDVDAGSWLPLDTKSANFDNIADVQTPSATLLDAYLDAASAISRLAVGDPRAAPTSATYKLPRLASQWDHADGAPMGTRGGVSVVHTFPADGEYVFSVLLHAIPTGQLFGSTAPFDEKVEISVNGERVALLEVDRGMSQADPKGMEMRTSPIPVRAGAQRIAAAFVRTFDGPVNDNIAPIGHSIADTQIGSQYGITDVAHLADFVVKGPYNATGVSETPSRRRIFTCRPTAPDEARPCAERIISALGGAAYRRPLAAGDVKALMAFYDRGAKEGGFELGIRTALEAILASPHFIFRIEEQPKNAKQGERYAIADFDLASRLSFFLWGTPPDETLISLARHETLSHLDVLEAQTKRMLADPRADALATRFAAQWLRLQDIEKVQPDALQYPDFRQQLADDMRRETELFFVNLVRENRSILELFSADYTFVNEALARHYGIPGVVGADFRRVTYPDDRRRGLLGQASILTLTSHANRTSPVLRGKWVMEVLLGSPPPPPPPNVPDLEKTGDAKDGHLLTTRERMEIHRENPTCRSCHQYMDPIGLALDNFDVTGQWRIRENGAPLDTRGELYDGTPVSNLVELERALLRRPTPLVRTFTRNLMAYALGRRVEYYDAPAVRRIASDAEMHGYHMQDFILGVVKSDAFRMKRVPVTRADQGGGR